MSISEFPYGFVAYWNKYPLQSVRISAMKEFLKKTLLWIQKYTKTDMLYLTKGGFWLLMGHAIHMGSGLVLAVAFANLLSSQSYGTYQYVIATGSILSAFTLSGIGTAIKHAVSKGNDGALRYGFKKKMIWSCGIVLCSGLISAYYFYNNNITLGTAFLFVGTFIPLIEGFSLYRSFLLGKKFFKENTLLGLWRKPLTLIFLLTALFLTDDPAILIFIYYLSSTVSLGLMYSLTVKKYNLLYKPSPEIIQYGKQLSVLGILRTLADNLDKVIIFQFLGAPQVVVYTLATLPLTHLQKLFGLTGHMAFPKFAERNLESIEKGLPRKLFIFFVTTILVVLLYLALAPYFFRYLFPEYTESILYSQVLILALLLKPITLFSQIFEAHKMIYIQQFSIISTLVLKIVLLFSLIQVFGLWGAVWATLLSSLYWAAVAAIGFYTRNKTTSF